MAEKDAKEGEPSHQLKAFEKIFIKAGEEKLVTFVLTKRDFSHYDVEKHAFVVCGGTYEIQAGTSSRDIFLRENIRY